MIDINCLCLLISVFRLKSINFKMEISQYKIMFSSTFNTKQIENIEKMRILIVIVENNTLDN